MIIQVQTPSGKESRIRLDAVRTVESKGENMSTRRFFVIYKTGRRKEVDYQSAVRVFDNLQPKLF